MSSIRTNSLPKWILIKFIQILLVSILLLSTIFAQPPLPLNEKKIITSLEQSYGQRAGKRGKAWFKLMQEKANTSELNKLNKGESIDQIAQAVINIRSSKCSII